MTLSLLATELLKANEHKQAAVALSIILITLAFDILPLLITLAISRPAEN